MKIVFITASLRQGGAERAISSLSNELVNRRNELIIYTLNKEKSFYTLDSKVSIVPLEFGGYGVIKNIYIIDSLRKQLKKDKPDVIVSFDSRTLLYSVLSATKSVKVVYSERSNPLVYPKSKIWRNIRNWAMEMGKVKLCVFQTRDVQALFRKKIQDKSIVIPNAIFNPQIENIKTPEKRENYISAMGRLVCDIKGFDVLIRAFSKISPEFPDIQLRIYGHGKDEEMLRKISIECNCVEKVELIKGNENAIEEVAKSRVFVLSSYFEGYPNALLEAMACGVPCISTNCKFGPSDIIKNKENGLLIDVGDEDNLAEALRTILKNPQYAEKLGTCATLYKKENSINKISMIWEDVIKKI